MNKIFKAVVLIIILVVILVITYSINVQHKTINTTTSTQPTTVATTTTVSISNYSVRNASKNALDSIAALHNVSIKYTESTSYPRQSGTGTYYIAYAGFIYTRYGNAIVLNIDDINDRMLARSVSINGTYTSCMDYNNSATHCNIQSADSPGLGVQGTFLNFLNSSYRSLPYYVGNGKVRLFSNLSVSDTYTNANAFGGECTMIVSYLYDPLYPTVSGSMSQCISHAYPGIPLAVSIVIHDPYYNNSNDNITFQLFGVSINSNINGTYFKSVATGNTLYPQ